MCHLEGPQPQEAVKRCQGNAKERQGDIKGRQIFAAQSAHAIGELISGWAGGQDVARLSWRFRSATGWHLVCYLACP